MKRSDIAALQISVGHASGHGQVHVHLRPSCARVVR
jgi:hypothetical protein